MASYAAPDWLLLANLTSGCRDLLQHYEKKKNGLMAYGWMLED